MRLMKDDIHFSISPFWYSIGGTFFSPIGAFFIDMPSHTKTTVYDWRVILALSIASILTFFGQVFASKAYQLEKAARVSFTNYIWIAVGVFTDLYIFDIKFFWTDIVGCILIVGMTFTTTFLKAIGKLGLDS